MTNTAIPQPASPAPATGAPHYAVLDGARGIAALAVMLYHVQTYIYPQAVSPAMPHLLRHSFLAVDLFFLMSGLVIARAYEARLLDGRMSFMQFCLVRCLRLYPLYLLGTGAGFVYALAKAYLLAGAPVSIGDHLFALVLNALFLPSTVNSLEGIFPFNPAAWSLSLEIGINLLFVMGGVKLSTPKLAIIAAVCGAALAYLGASGGSYDMGWGASTAVGGGMRIGFSFTLGVIIYRLLCAGKLRVPAVHPLWLLLVLGYFLLTPVGTPGLVHDTLSIYVVFPLFAIMACQCKAAPRALPLFQALGVLSYALYILHNPLMSWFGGVWKVIFHEELAVKTTLSAPLLISTIIAVSYLVARFGDEPLRRALQRRLK